MTPAEARAKLTRDATIHGAEFIAVHRNTLLLALSDPATSVVPTESKKRRPKQTSTDTQS